MTRPSAPPPPPPPRPRRATLLAAAALLLAAGYALGVYSLARDLWPLAPLRELRRDARLASHPVDAVGRLLAAPGKTPLACPPQGADTAVLLVIGQSNAANHAEAPRRTAYPDRVVAFHAGQCSVAASPLLGATGTDGEFATPLADALVRDGTFRSVVLLAGGVAESSILRWQAEGDLNVDLLATLRAAASRYRVTHVVWHQGEADAMNRTATAVYARAFASMRESLAGIGVAAPLFIAVATRCGPPAAWRPDNPTALAQRALVDERSVFLGADTDALLGPADRRPGEPCHLGARGQQKVAEAYAQAIRQQAQPRR